MDCQHSHSVRRSQALDHSCGGDSGGRRSLQNNKQDDILSEVVAALFASISLPHPETINDVIAGLTSEFPQSKLPESHPHLSVVCKKAPCTKSLTPRSDISELGQQVVSDENIIIAGLPRESPQPKIPVLEEWHEEELAELGTPPPVAEHLPIVCKKSPCAISFSTEPRSDISELGAGHSSVGPSVEDPSQASFQEKLGKFDAAPKHAAFVSGSKLNSEAEPFIPLSIFSCPRCAGYLCGGLLCEAPKEETKPVETIGTEMSKGLPSESPPPETPKPLSIFSCPRCAGYLCGGLLCEAPKEETKPVETIGTEMSTGLPSESPPSEIPKPLSILSCPQCAGYLCGGLLCESPKEETKAVDTIGTEMSTGLPRESPQPKIPEPHPHLSVVCEKSPCATSLTPGSDISELGCSRRGQQVVSDENVIIACLPSENPQPKIPVPSLAKVPSQPKMFVIHEWYEEELAELQTASTVPVFYIGDEPEKSSSVCDDMELDLTSKEHQNMNLAEAEQQEVRANVAGGLDSCTKDFSSVGCSFQGPLPAPHLDLKNPFVCKKSPRGSRQPSGGPPNLGSIPFLIQISQFSAAMARRRSKCEGVLEGPLGQEKLRNSEAKHADDANGSIGTEISAGLPSEIPQSKIPVPDLDLSVVCKNSPRGSHQPSGGPPNPGSIPFLIQTSQLSAAMARRRSKCEGVLEGPLAQEKLRNSEAKHAEDANGSIGTEMSAGLPGESPQPKIPVPHLDLSVVCTKSPRGSQQHSGRPQNLGSIPLPKADVDKMSGAMARRRSKCEGVLEGPLGQEKLRNSEAKHADDVNGSIGTEMSAGLPSEIPQSKIPVPDLDLSVVCKRSPRGSRQPSGCQAAHAVASRGQPAGPCATSLTPRSDISEPGAEHDLDQLKNNCLKRLASLASEIPQSKMPVPLLDLSVVCKKSPRGSRQPSGCPAGHGAASRGQLAGRKLSHIDDLDQLKSNCLQRLAALRSEIPQPEVPVPLLDLSLVCKKSPCKTSPRAKSIQKASLKTILESWANVTKIYRQSPCKKSPRAKSIQKASLETILESWANVKEKYKCEYSQNGQESAGNSERALLQPGVSDSAFGTSSKILTSGETNLAQGLRKRERKAYLECLKEDSPRTQFGEVAVNASSAGKACKAIVSFAVLCQTNFDEEVRIVGNVPALGQWDPDCGAPMKWSAGHIWQATIEVEFSTAISGNSLEFKYVMMSKGKLLRWESGKNHSVNQPPNGSSLIFRNVWDYAS